MNHERFIQCLETARWTTEVLAEALGCDDSLTEAYAVGLATIPPELAAWLETLAAHHRAVEDLKPTGLKGKRFTECDL